MQRMQAIVQNMQYAYVSNMQEHLALRALAQCYACEADFFAQVDSMHFDEQVSTGVVWMGFVRDDAGTLRLAGEYKYDLTDDSDNGQGTGWML